MDGRSPRFQPSEDDTMTDPTPASRRRAWILRGMAAGLVALACQQVWRHGRDYVFADRFAVVEPGKIYRGAWQQPWPMRRLIRTYRIKTILALAHPSDHPLAARERALARELGVRWIHVPIAERRGFHGSPILFDRLEEAAAVLGNPDNYPIYFHCHHGINRASMAQVAYRTKCCGWTFERAADEIVRNFGLTRSMSGPDYRRIQRFYAQRVQPHRGPRALDARGPGPHRL